jgi:predicted nucleic acid-binding protein
MQVVAGTSALVSLGVVAGCEPNPLDHLLGRHSIAIPRRVVAELEETAAYDDTSGKAAAAVLDRRGEFSVRTVELDETFPLDEGENAAVSLANNVDAAQFLCDEFNRLALVHTSLTTSRLITTPILLVVLVRTGAFSPATAETLLEDITDARSRSGNTHAARARVTLNR